MNYNDISSKIDVEALLAEGKAIRISPQGYSMYPLFVPGRDEAVIVPVDMERLKRGDVVLYRRDNSILVLHRIWKRRGDNFYMVGDNQKDIEGPLRGDQIKGILWEIVRRERHFDVQHPVYRVFSCIWLLLRPFRPFISKLVSKGKRMGRNMSSSR